MAKKTTPDPRPGTAAEWRTRRNAIRAQANDALDRLGRCTDPSEAASLRALLDVLPNQLHAAVGAFEVTTLLEKRDRADEQQHRADLWRQRADQERSRLAGLTDPDEIEIQHAYIKLIEDKAGLLSRLAEAALASVHDGIDPTDEKTWPGSVQKSASNARRILRAAIHQTTTTGKTVFRHATTA